MKVRQRVSIVDLFIFSVKSGGIIAISARNGAKIRKG